MGQPPHRSCLPRSAEVAVSLIVLALASPFLLVAAIAIAVTSPGPILFRHERIGRTGRRFAMLKFRTMRTGSSGPQVTAKRDPRISPVGRVLRKTKLDELPELWNVVRGDMSLVGPRPEAAPYVDVANPLWRAVLAVRPGITDPITLRLRNEEELLALAGADPETFYRRYLLPYKLRGYREYLASRSWKSDVRVLWLTALGIVFPGRVPPPSPGEIVSAIDSGGNSRPKRSHNADQSRSTDGETPMTMLHVPFFRPDIGNAEIEEVVATVRSGWLTTGPKVKSFEDGFRTAVNARSALAVNSCTAALHLALEALGVKAGDAVLVPTMTFAATAEVVRYQGATPVLVDCDPCDLNMDLADAARKLEQLKSGRLAPKIGDRLVPRGIMPVHVGGMMMDIRAVHDFATRHGLWIVEDGAHAFPAAWRPGPADPWQQCGEATATVSCFSFYANKTITTGEGGMVVTDDSRLAERMRLMALHGLSADAWSRYAGTGSWDYKIVAPGFKYNLTDIAAAIGIHQLARAEQMRQRREQIARRYFEAFADLYELELPPDNPDRLHAWHLFPVKLRLETLSIDRAQFIRELHSAGIGTSVHWRPLHLHPYYREGFGWRPEECPVATSAWERLVSLPIFSAMRDEEVASVISVIRTLCARYARAAVAVGQDSSDRPSPVDGLVPVS